MSDSSQDFKPTRGWIGDIRLMQRAAAVGNATPGKQTKWKKVMNEMSCLTRSEPDYSEYSLGDQRSLIWCQRMYDDPKNDWLLASEKQLLFGLMEDNLQKKELPN